MRYISTFSILFLISLTINSCNKEEYFQSESGIRKELEGTWNLIPIPRFDYQTDGSKYVHLESWTFSESTVSIINNSQSAASSYSVNTSLSKAEIKIENVQPNFVSPARVRTLNGTWQIVQLDEDFLIIANDQDGQTGLTELEFQKKH